MEDQQSDFKLKRFSSWLKMQGVLQEPSSENNMTEERLARRIKRLEDEKFFDNSAGEETFGVEGASSGIQLLMKPSQERGVGESSAKSSAEWQTLEGKTR